MKTLNFCIRCHSLRDGDRKFSPDQIISIWLMREAGMEFEFKKDVCAYCRQGIGDEIADKMLKQCSQ